MVFHAIATAVLGPALALPSSSSSWGLFGSTDRCQCILMIAGKVEVYLSLHASSIRDSSVCGCRSDVSSYVSTSPVL